LAVSGGQGEDVEGVGGDYVDGEEVDLGGGVGDAVVVEAAAVGVFLAALEGAFDLDAEEVALVVDYEVVGGVVSVGLARIRPSSMARRMKWSSAHSPRSLGWWM